MPRASGRACARVPAARTASRAPCAQVISYNGVGHAFWADMAQIEGEQMPQIAAYRLATNFLRGFYAGKESFAKKRDFLEFMLAQEDAQSEEEDTQGEQSDDDEQ